MVICGIIVIDHIRGVMSLQNRFKKIRKECTLKDGIFCQGRGWTKKTAFYKCKLKNCPRLLDSVRKKNEDNQFNNYITFDQ
jgi:hypothetical protein